MRTMLIALSVLISALGVADDWTPPKDPDPQVILSEAQADAKAGNFEVALAKHLWFHENALAIRPSLTGVRLSFAMSAWLKLGESYPPALEKLKEVRDETEKRIRDQDQVRVRFEDFHDLVAINRTLREEERTEEVFRWLDEFAEEDARRMFNVATPALIKQKAFELCGKYIDPPSDLARIGENYTRSLKMAGGKFGDSLREFAEKKLLNDAAILVAILVQNDRNIEAETAVKQAKRFVENTELQDKLDRQLQSALSGTVPQPWP